MSNEYRNNHYVPVWYQRHFVPPGQTDQELHYLDLLPKEVRSPRGILLPQKNPKKQGFRFCFAEKDLYTTKIQGVDSTLIEQHFFGDIDKRGHRAVRYFTDFAHPSVGDKALQDMMIYMSTQKLRTPKGLDWLAKQQISRYIRTPLKLMLDYRFLFCALWTECIWQIADASKSETKFIVSDHPVTVYNRRCGPRSDWCRGSNDPGTWFNGTHTIFPLSLNKILILTNLSWVRNPYQPETSIRPNPELFREAIFKYTDIQTLRFLSEEEVLELNYIIKRRAYRYIAAAKPEWLYPEEKLPVRQWNTFGDGYLCMPDPRPIHLGGEIYIGHNDGTSSAYDEYGRRPWQEDFGIETRKMTERDSLDRFKGEFSRLYGPYRRGRTFNGMFLDHEKDGDEFHQYHLGLEKKKRK